MRELLVLLGLYSLIQGSFSQIFVESREKQQDAWKSYPVEQFSDSPGFKYIPATINKYGSNTAHRLTGTGFFRAEKVDGRWYIIDPEGYTYIHKGVACVAPGTSIKQKAAVTAKWGTNEGWSVHATNWLKSNGFNGSGAWSNVTLLRTKPEPVVYSVIINPMSTYRNMHRGLVGGYTNAGWQGYEHNIIRVFDPAFETYMDNACKPLAQYKNDKHLLGYFVDNELPWVNDALDRHLKFLATDDHGYIAAKNWLSARKGRDAGLSDVTQDDRNAFWDFYAGKFFSMAKQYITKYDPNHMFLGSRFNQRHEELANPYIFETAGKYCDIISINHYREWEPIASRMSNWEAWANKPFMITEFYTKGEDTGLPNVTGAGWLVKTQHDRGLFYQNFIIKLLKSKGCVGWDWFRYQDNDPEDLTTDPSNRDANKGLIDSNYDDHARAMALCKYTNDRVYGYLDFLKNVEKDSGMLVMPAKDSFVRLMDSDNSVYGTDQLLRVKNSKGTTYERSALLQFDFSPVSEILDHVGKIELNMGLVGVYPGANDPSTVNMYAYHVTNMPFGETDPNAVLLSAYRQRNEMFAGSVAIPVNANAKNQIFTVDITSLLSVIAENPQLIIRLQMDIDTETQFEFASREHVNTSLRPSVRVKSVSQQTDVEVQKQSDARAFVRDSSLIILGFQPEAHIKLYNLRGELLYAVTSNSDNHISLPLRADWGNVLIVNVVGEKTIKTLI